MRMNIKTDINQLEKVCEIVVGECEKSYTHVFGKPCRRKKCWGSCPFLNEYTMLEWLRGGFNEDLVEDTLRSKRT